MVVKCMESICLTQTETPHCIASRLQRDNSLASTGKCDTHTTRPQKSPSLFSKTLQHDDGLDILITDNPGVPAPNTDSIEPPATVAHPTPARLARQTLLGRQRNDHESARIGSVMPLSKWPRSQSTKLRFLGRRGERGGRGSVWRRRKHVQSAILSKRLIR